MSHYGPFDRSRTCTDSRDAGMGSRDMVMGPHDKGSDRDDTDLNPHDMVLNWDDTRWSLHDRGSDRYDRGLTGKNRR
jgi:hypothetical protein